MKNGEKKCLHNVRRSYCRICVGGMICKICHRRRDRCQHNNGTEICVAHKRRKEQCKACHPDLVMLSKIRQICRRALRKAQFQKSSLWRSVETLGCSVQEFERHIQKKIEWWNARFSPKMTVDDADLDHIKPLHELKLMLENLKTSILPEELEAMVRRMMHFTNIQPLPRIINIMKKAYWDAEDETNWTRDISYNSYEKIYLPAHVWKFVTKDAEPSHTHTPITLPNTLKSYNSQMFQDRRQPKITNFFQFVH